MLHFLVRNRFFTPVDVIVHVLVAYRVKTVPDTQASCVGAATEAGSGVEACIVSAEGGAATLPPPSIPIPDAAFSGNPCSVGNGAGVRAAGRFGPTRPANRS